MEKKVFLKALIMFFSLGCFISIISSQEQSKLSVCKCIKYVQGKEKFSNDECIKISLINTCSVGIITHIGVRVKVKNGWYILVPDLFSKDPYKVNTQAYFEPGKMKEIEWNKKSLAEYLPLSSTGLPVSLYDIRAGGIFDFFVLDTNLKNKSNEKSLHEFILQPTYKYIGKNCLNKLQIEGDSEILANNHIVFKVRNCNKNPIFAYFGIKAKINNKWRVITIDIRNTNRILEVPAIQIDPNEQKTIEWNMNVSVNYSEVLKYWHSVAGFFPYPIDLKNGGEFLLFAWEKSPMPEYGNHIPLKIFRINKENWGK